MNRTDDVRKYAAEQGVTEEEALKRGMEAKSKEFPAVAALSSGRRRLFAACGLPARRQRPLGQPVRSRDHSSAARLRGRVFEC